MKLIIGCLLALCAASASATQWDVTRFLQKAAKETVPIPNQASNAFGRPIKIAADEVGEASAAELIGKASDFARAGRFREMVLTLEAAHTRAAGLAADEKAEIESSIRAVLDQGLRPHLEEKLAQAGRRADRGDVFGMSLSLSSALDSSGPYLGSLASLVDPDLRSWVESRAKKISGRGAVAGVQTQLDNARYFAKKKYWVNYWLNLGTYISLTRGSAKTAEERGLDYTVDGKPGSMPLVEAELAKLHVIHVRKAFAWETARAADAAPSLRPGHMAAADAWYRVAQADGIELSAEAVSSYLRLVRDDSQDALPR